MFGNCIIKHATLNYNVSWNNMILIANLQEQINYQHNNLQFHKQKQKTHNLKKKKKKKKKNLTKVFNFLDLKLTSMQTLFHLCQPSLDFLTQVMCPNPILKKCENETHTPKMGTWESSRTPKLLEFDCRG